MTAADLYVGDSRETMRAWAADGGIPTPWGPQRAHLILTSPPFLALRSYLPDDDPAKSSEMGSEPTPAAFLDALLDWTAACADVLSPEGSLAVELGDTYSGSGGAGGDYTALGMRTAQPQFRQSRSGRSADEWPDEKSRTMIPELYRIALAYGINPLTGAESPAGRWLVRNVVTWCRPNPSPGAPGDKYRPATSDLVIATRSGKRWFDLDAVREPAASTYKPSIGTRKKDKRDGGGSGHGVMADVIASNPAGAPPLDYWVVPTQPYSGSHYAAWPPRLCEIPIKSMCPAEVSISTGEGRRRITEAQRCLDGHPVDNAPALGDDKARRSQHGEPSNSRWSTDRTTLGWTDTDPDGQYRPGIVLDPFAGSGTTLAVATGHGRYAVGIDLDRRNAELAAGRVGPLFLTIHRRFS